MSDLSDSLTRSTLQNASAFCGSSLTTSSFLNQSGSAINTQLEPLIGQANVRSASASEAAVTLNPDDGLITADPIGALQATPVRLSDSISSSNPTKYYGFSLNNASNFNLALTGLAADANVQLLSANGTVLNASEQPNLADEAINQTLDAGTYYVRVFQLSGETPYDLNLSATPTSPSQSPSNLLPTEFDLETLGNAALNLQSAVGSTNTTNVYRFHLSTDSSLSLELLGLSADADVRLIRDANNNGIVDPDEEIDRSQHRNTANEAIGVPFLSAGTYFAQVYQYSGNSNYTFRLSATPSYRPVPIAALSTISASATSVDGAGNSLAAARDIGVLGKQQTFNDFVGNDDPFDYYHFKLNATSTVYLNLSGLSTDADLQLISNQATSIQLSDATGTAPESITRTLLAGDYYVRVYRYSGDTSYTLSLSGTPQKLASGYSSSFGYGEVDAAAAVARALGQSPFPAVTDLGGTQWDLDQINAPEAWAKGYTGQGITVAVVDSGVDYSHPDLDANLWTNTSEIAGNGVDDDTNGYVDDVRGWDFVDSDNTPLDADSHGTHVAGTIAAENNGTGITGVAYGARIMPVRVLDETGSGTNVDIAAGIRYAANNGARVINLSLGGGGYSESIASAVQYAYQKGAVVVLAAGNEGASDPEFPANLATQWGIAVGAVDSNQQVTSFSNDSGSSSTLKYVVAPGKDIYSTIPNQSYAYYDGTSMAAPHVAGVAALILSANPNLSATQVINILTETANKAVTA
ncbi:S8 family serine peptidase [Kovacikia minuta CCNUW1]|uniref:S8 family serine peptidase n=1 Tax=Kovacikia minuta TaxID=2931930 RepID=UPI001CCF1618|nr:S8 family serine peptidase [Kovacikia minuta]UBF23735.1 S8 family serine peptidase [Kovacikia minuta CCNUW1]